MQQLMSMAQAPPAPPGSATRYVALDGTLREIQDHGREIELREARYVRGATRRVLARPARLVISISGVEVYELALLGQVPEGSPADPVTEADLAELRDLVVEQLLRGDDSIDCRALLASVRSRRAHAAAVTADVPRFIVDRGEG